MPETGRNSEAEEVLAREDRPVFHPGSIERFSGEDRDITEYMQLLKLSILELKDKAVLDIGSGINARFARRARRAGLNIMSVNPSLREQKYRDALSNAYQRDSKSYDAPAAVPSFFVAALAQELPFKDENFDVVMSVFGVPHYLHDLDPIAVRKQKKLQGNDFEYIYGQAVRQRDKTEIKKAFLETLRVLKPNGKAYFVDSYNAPGTDFFDPYSPTKDGSEVVEVLQELEANGIHVEINEEILSKKYFGAEVSQLFRRIVLTKP